MATIEPAEKPRPAERGGERKLAVAFLGAIATLYAAIGYVVYLVLF